MQRPIVIITIGYVIGIIWGLCFRINIALFTPILVLFLFFLAKAINFTLKELKCKIKETTIIFLCVCAIISNTRLSVLNVKYNTLYNNLENIELTGTIISDPKLNTYNTTYKLKVETINNNKKYQNTQVYLKVKDNTLKFGNKIRLKGEFIEPTVARNYKGFNYKEYLKTIKIYGTVKNSSTVKILQENNCNIIQNTIYKISFGIKQIINNILPNQSANLLTGIILGDKTNLDDSIEDKFRLTGLSHVLAVSGMHVNYLIMGILILLEKFKLNKRFIQVIAIIFLNVFMALTGFTPSIIRATIMASTVLLGNIVYRKNDISTSISISLLIILIINPFNINNIGLQLSFGGTIGIVVFYKNILKILDKMIKTKNKIISSAKKLSAVSISAQILIFPIMIYHFGTFVTVFLLSNIMTSYLIGIIIIIGVCNIFIGAISITLGKIIGIALNIPIQIIIRITEVLSNIPLSQIYLITPGEPLFIIYYVLIFILNSFGLSSVKRVLKKQKVISTVLVVAIILNTINYIPNQLQIYFIDVGQGDSTLIITPDNKKILIDGGGNKDMKEFDVGERILVPYLLKRRIKTIDCMMISHFDADHCNGLLAVIKHLNVKNIIISKHQITDEYNNIINLAKEKGINTKEVAKGDLLKIGKYIDIKILYPNKNHEIQEASNNNSIVAKLEYNKFSMLFTGDIEYEVEQELIRDIKLELRSNILKVSHHGSKTSSTEEFIKLVNPKIALIGVGANNTFGHPNQAVLLRLNKLNTKVYRTDICGEIKIKIYRNGKIKLSHKM